jgi:hypothetical protein
VLIFYFVHPSTNWCPSLQAIEKPSWSLWLDLNMKCTTQLRNLTYNCMCGVQRWGSHSKIMLTTIIEHGMSPCNLLCNLLSTFLHLNLFKLDITNGLNTYWLKTFQRRKIIIIILNMFYKENFTLKWYGIGFRSVTQHLKVIHFKFRL